MTDKQLAEIRERLNAASPTPWVIWDKGNSIKQLVIESVAYEGQPAQKVCSGMSPKNGNANFIANAPEDIRNLLDYIERLRTAAREVTNSLKCGANGDELENDVSGICPSDWSCTDCPYKKLASLIGDDGK
jgi:hypothetical protein